MLFNKALDQENGQEFDRNIDSAWNHSQSILSIVFNDPILQSI